MLRRSFVLVFVSLIFVLVLAVCGQGTTTVEESPSGEPTVAPSPSPGQESLPAKSPTPGRLAPTPTSAIEPQIAESPGPALSPTPASTRVAAATQAPAETATAIPLTGVNGEAQAADHVSFESEPDELSTVEVVKLLTPSVVQIFTESLAMGDFNQPVPTQGIGTGIILDTEGHILTNNHVIAGAQRITVTLSNGESYSAVLVGGDVDTDTAVIRIEADGLQPATLGRSSELEVGETVIAIGHALGLPGGPTVSKGVVSALGRSISVNPQVTMVDLIQTDASINPGNSGGALVNTRGEVIGMNSAGIPSAQGIGFAINIDDAKFIAAQLQLRGYVDRSSIGISPFNLNPGLANLLGVPVIEGVAVQQLTPGGAADVAGLEVEDVIVRIGDQPIRDTGELSLFLSAHAAGETVTVVFFRGDQQKTARITLQAPAR